MIAVRRFESLVKTYNKNKECGFCWVFSAPQNNDIKKPLYKEYPEDCCNVVEVQMLDYQVLGYNREGKRRMIISETAEREIFDLDIRIMTKAGKPVFDGSNKDEWSEIIEPLLKCIRNLLFDCVVANSFFLEDWQIEPNIKKNEGFTGISVNCSYKKYLR